MAHGSTTLYTSSPQGHMVMPRREVLVQLDDELDETLDPSPNNRPRFRRPGGRSVSATHVIAEESQ